MKYGKKIDRNREMIQPSKNLHNYLNPGLNLVSYLLRESVLLINFTMVHLIYSGTKRVRRNKYGDEIEE